MSRAVRQRAKRRWRAVALAPLVAGACGGPATDPGPAPPATTCPIPAALSAPRFGSDVLRMLRQTCGSGSNTCHGPSSPVGHVSYSPSLTATEVWNQLVNVDPSAAPPNAGWKRIAPNDVPHSWLIEKVTKDDPGGVGQPYGNRMPYGLPNLCDATVQTLVNWIDRGAPND